MNISDLKSYFLSIDTSQNGKLDKEEVENAKKDSSIFSSIIEDGIDCMTYVSKFVSTYKDKFSKEDVKSFQNLPYRFESTPKSQHQVWSKLDNIYTKDYVDSDPFNIKTAEGVAVSSELNFNTADGEYMLKHLSFDSETFKDTPKNNLPEGFIPEEIIEKGKNPGLKIKEMHKMGYTGKNVVVACIDTPILTEHESIKSNIVGYEVMNGSLIQDEAYFHGQAVADLLSGKETGAAPDSKLVYFAENGTNKDRLQALQRIVEINKNSNEEDKIKVLSISWDVDEGEECYSEYKALIQELVSQDVFVVTAGFSMVDGTLGGVVFEKGCLEKVDQNGEPEDFNNYIGASDYGGINPNETILVPSGDRTVASAMGENKYRHDSKSSTSWSVPALAGVYASLLQCAEENGVKLTPAKFKEWALETGVAIKDKDGNLGGYAINAEALCNKIIEVGAKEHSFGI